MAHFVGGRQRAAAYGGPQGEVAGIERDSLLGVYRALFPRNVPLDYVHINELSAESLKQYKLVILPYPLMLPEAAAPVLTRYVEAGGTLVAEARLGWSNERGNASDRIPGMGLWELMGCRETAVQTGAKRPHRAALDRGGHPEALARSCPPAGMRRRSSRSRRARVSSRSSRTDRRPPSCLLTGKAER